MNDEEKKNRIVSLTDKRRIRYNTSVTKDLTIIGTFLVIMMNYYGFALFLLLFGQFYRMIPFLTIAVIFNIIGYLAMLNLEEKENQYLLKYGKNIQRNKSM
jgi:hypothetical protein